MDPQTAAAHILAQQKKRHVHDYFRLNYKQAVLATLAYFDLFKFPLTQEETVRYLFKLEPDRHHVEVTLNESRLIQNRGSYYQLKGPKDHIATRHDRTIIAQKFWERVDRFRWAFALTPYIRLVAVCNNLAYNNTSETSDIDLFVVTKPGRMFISRLILTFWLQLFGVRRHGDKVAGRFCLSFFATQGYLNFETIKKEPFDIYLAYWLQTLQPISGDPNTYDELLRTNKEWLKDFFRYPIQPNTKHFRTNTGWLTTLQRWQEKILDTKWGTRLEEKLATWQIKRAKTKRESLDKTQENGIVITRNMLKFHNIDRRREFYERWLKRLEELLKP